MAWPRIVGGVDQPELGQARAAGDAKLVRDEVPAGHRLGDRMLDLESRVHLEEEELAGIGQEHLDGPGADVPDGCRDREGRPRPSARAAPE